jgi:3-oxoadipate enol-lactonase
MLQATRSDGYAACCAAIRDADFRSRLQEIGTPTLVIAGTYDPVTPPTDGQFLAERIPEARYVELTAAHLSNVEAVAEFNRALLDFLSA